MAESILDIAIGSDHAGFLTKEFVKRTLVEKGYIVRDFGTYSEESMDYPDSAHPLSKAVQDGYYHYGILICGSANGMAIVANKYKGIRAAICWNDQVTELARKHNNANIIALPARFISEEEAAKLSMLFITTNFEGGRHVRRVEKIENVL